MTTKKYIDIKITNDDIELDAYGMPVYVWNKDSIVQDIRHAIRESGYLVSMVAERSAERRRLWKQKIILLVETDKRIVPGTVVMTEAETTNSTGIWTLSADTYEFGAASLILEA